MKHFELGASIYVPSTRDDLSAVINGDKFKARSVIFCTEDSISESDIPKGLKNLQSMLNDYEPRKGVLNFIRVRNQKVFKSILSLQDLDKIDGFVLPKITQYNVLEYLELLSFDIKNKFYVMPTLETKEVFEESEMRNLSNLLELYKKKVLSLRIGGNDLLNILGVRRSKYRTIYETPLNVTISNLILMFKSKGYNLSSPVCEFLHDYEILRKEVPIDLEYGLFGKTAIHPDQIKVIETFYKPTETDFEMAQAILDPSKPAVFGMHGVMCEKTTHTNWANEIIKRAEVYGIFGQHN